MALIPPIPVSAVPGSFFWNDWIEKVRTLINSLSQGKIDHQSLLNLQGGNSTERYHFTAAEHSTLTGLPTLSSGTYTPTLTANANITASTAHPAQYMRVGSVVTVSSYIDVTPNTAGVSTSIKISLPIASNLGNAYELGGTANSNTVVSESAGIYAEPTSDTALMQWITTVNTNHSMMFSFTYRII